MQKIRPGEVWLADLGIAAKLRPVVLISRPDVDPPRALVIYVPLTTKSRGSKYEVDLGRVAFLQEQSTANVQGIGSIPTIRLKRHLGQLPDDLLSAIHEAMRFAMDL